MESVKINAELITTFHTFTEWVNKASSRIGGFQRDQQIICVDKNGDCLTIGMDFQIADEGKLFPVKAYRLVRTSEKNKTTPAILPLEPFMGFKISIMEHPVLQDGSAVLHLSHNDYKSYMCKIDNQKEKANGEK